MSIRFKGIPLSMAVAILVGACGEKAPPPAPPPPPPPAAPVAQTPEGVTYAPSLEVDLTKMTKDSFGVYSRDLKVGKGATAAKGKTLTLNYTGWTADGQQFDSSVGKEPIQIILGESPLINGWHVGIDGMKIGGKRMLVIPPAQGYGDAGNPPIPGGAVLVFVVELLTVK